MGAVYVGIAVDSGGLAYTSAAAHFDLSSEQPNCTRQTFGDCRVTTCEPSADSLTKPDAGPITLNFAGQFSEELYPTDDGYYGDYGNSLSLQLASPGDTISVTAKGGQIPAFSGSIVQPAALRLTSPATAAGGYLYVHDDADLELTFTGGISGVWLAAGSQVSYSNGGWSSVQCSFASQAGHTLIPKAVLHSIGYLSLYSYRAKTVPAGDYAIDLEARAVVFDTAGLNSASIYVGNY